MSGIVSGINYSLLFGGTSSASDTAASMLTTLYSGATASSSTAVSTGNPIVDLKLAEQNQTADVAKEAKNPTVIRDLAAFTAGIANAKDLNTALQNPTVLKVLLTANGMADQLQYTALASKALQSDPTDPNSLVNQLSDTRWKTLATTYNLATKGLAGLQDPTVQSQIANQYESVTWMNSLDQATPGLAEAIQFKQQASQITSVDQILGNPINWDVVLTALGIPQQIAYQDLPAQEQAVSSRLDITKLQDPTFVNSLTDQYLLAKQQQAQSTSATPSLDALAVQASGLVV
ncbi:MAG: DUF1217 domain-containing protein [Acetobacteraceae bacterium]